MNQLKQYIRQVLKEGVSSDTLVIVDIQPAYESNTPFDIGEMLEWAHTNYSRILVLWNGPDLGFVDKQGLMSFYFEKLGEYLGDYELADEMVYEFGQKSEFFDKGYGFFRDLMDDDRCYPRQHIIKIVKYMLGNDVRMLGDLTEEQFEEIGVPDLLFDELEDYGFHVPDLAEELPDWSGSDIVGGDEDECMAEVLILGTAQGLSFNKIPEYIY
tara:strand:- start:39930 stop:40568 length:639 start_codon:yes stop_codon:yes gene_type:complete